MKITKLKIENFMAIGKIDCALDEKGLVLIQGENKDDSSQDSNGSGKSALPEALFWCLFGKTSRGVGGDSVVNRSVGKGCRVEINIVDGEDEYHIARHRKHKTQKNRLTVTLAGKSLTKGTDALTQQLITKILGCSEDVFKAAVYAAQDGMPDLPGMTDKFLKQLVEEAAGVDKLHEAYAIARQRLGKLAGRVEVLDMSLTQMNDIEMTSLAANQSRIEEQSAEWLVDREERAEMMDERVKKFGIEKLELEAAYNPEIVEKLGQAEEKLLGAMDVYEQEKGKVDKMKIGIQKFTSESASSMRMQSSLNAKIESAMRDRENADARVGTPCKECGAEIVHESLTDIYDHLDETIFMLKGELSDELMDYDAITEKKVKLEGFLSRFHLPDVSTTMEKLKRIREAIKTQESQVARIKSVSDSIASLSEKIADIKKESNPHLLTMANLDEQIEALKVRIHSSKTEKAELESKMILAKAAQQVFSPSGVRAHILDTVTPFLNDRTSDYLSQLTDGNINAVWDTLDTTKKGEIREKFHIQVSSLTGAQEFGGLSGGEKRKVRLACAMALQDMVASRASKPIGLFIADEIDHALDESGLERLMGLLDLKAKDRGTVLTISHNSLSDWIRQTVTVTKQDGLSTMSGEYL